MKTIRELLVSGLPRKSFLVTAILVTLGISIDTALNVSHVMVFFSLILLSALFSSLYFKSEHHPTQVGIVSIMMGIIYPMAFPNDLAWWRLSCYSIPFWITGMLFISCCLVEKHSYHGHFRAN
ncbi:MAG: hypothetical protein HXX13_13950 [Bacteroidetes bacterium]|nr:hypothetical protein [Bacteroidota bacterium]